MRQQYELDDLHWGKYDSPMAKFLYENVLMNGDFGDDEYSDGEGTWGSRYGRRVLEGDDRGFVYYTRFDTEAEAIDAFTSIMEYYASLEGDDGWED